MKKLVVLFTLLPLLVCAQVNIKEVLPLTYANITKNAKEKWPDDFEMQKYTIDGQCKALNEYISLQKDQGGIPEMDFAKIAIGALNKWCKNDWSECLKNNEKLDESQACLDADWEMIVYTIKKQIKAYNEIN